MNHCEKVKKLLANMDLMQVSVEEAAAAVRGLGKLAAWDSDDNIYNWGGHLRLSSLLQHQSEEIGIHDLHAEVAKTISICSYENLDMANGLLFAGAKDALVELIPITPDAHVFHDFARYALLYMHDAYRLAGNDGSPYFMSFETENLEGFRRLAKPFPYANRNVPICWSCGAENPEYNCNGCSIALYCGRDCQAKDWKKKNGGGNHRVLCNQS